MHPDKAILFLCLLATSISWSQTGDNKQLPVEKIKAVEQSLSPWVELEGVPKWNIHDRMKHYQTKGVSIAVIKDYKIEWTKGYGFANEEEKKPVTNATLFQAGSISKSLNGVGLLTLLRDKKIDLYTDINTYLRSWKFPYDSISKLKTISLANLLSHTAGLSVHGFPGYAFGDSIPSIKEILDGKRPANTAAVRSVFEPGLKFKYSGGGTTISQLLLMDVTGNSYDDYMWENVLKPLGMMQSTYKQPYDSFAIENYATGYYNDGMKVKGKFHLYPEQGAAGLWTNPTDLCRYIIETQLALAGNSGKVLSKELTELRLTPYIDGSAALGVFISTKEGKKYFSHNGQDEGFTAVYLADFSGNGVVVMSNSNNGALNGEIVNSVASVYNLKGLSPVKKKSISPTDTELDKFTGIYKIGEDTVIISRREHHLVAGIKGTPIEWKLYFTSATEFVIQEVTGQFSVIKEEGDKVKEIRLKQDSYLDVLRRIE